MDDKFDKRIGELISDNVSGSRTIVSKAAALFEEVVAGKWFSSAELVQRLRDACARLRKAHPSLVAVQKLCEALEQELAGGETLVEERVSGIFEQWRSDHFEALVSSITRHLIPLIKSGYRIFCHSRSGTVLGVLKLVQISVDNISVVQTVSYPMKEGVVMAREIAEAGINVRLIADAGAATGVANCDLVLLGADSIYRSGVVNKLGSLGIALAAQHYVVPVYAVADSSKLITGESAPHIVRQDPAELTDLQLPGIEVENVYFEITPLELFKNIVTEEGVFSPGQLRTQL